MGIRTRGIDIKAGAAIHVANEAARTEAKAVACMMGLEGIVSKPIVPDHRAIGYVAGLNALEPVSGESRTSLCSTGNS